MGWFKKKNKIIDLAEDYNLNAKINSQKIPSSSKQSSSGGMFGIFGDGFASSTSTTSGEIADSSLTPDERRQKLARRLKDMTAKIEDLSNQIYHLQQRIELLERKTNVNKIGD